MICSLEIARNPARRQEMMRSYDRAMSNIENIPGGFSHLARIHSEIQEPLMEALNPRGNAPAPGTNIQTPVAGAPNSEPLPNPWAAPS